MRILFNTVITFLSITYAFESYAAAAELPENGHLARISIVRDSGLSDEEIIKVVKNGGNLTIHRSRTSGVVEKDDDPTEYSRHLSLFKVYSRLLTEYYIGRDSEKRIDQLLLLARVVVDKGLEDIGTFFPDRNSLYDYISRELHKQRMSTDVTTYKTHLAIREAHIFLSKAEEAADPETRNEFFRKAYNLFETPYKITMNKHGFPWLVKIIIDHGYLAGQETREGALALAKKLLDTYAIPRDRGESLSSVEPETEGGRAAKEQHRVRIPDTMKTSSDLALTMGALLSSRQRQEGVDGSPADLGEMGDGFSAATASTFAAAPVGFSSSSSSSAAAFAAAATAPVGFLTTIAAAATSESPFVTAAPGESPQHLLVAAGSVASEENGDRFSVDTAFGSVDTASVVLHEFSPSSSSSSAAASTAAGETAAVVERQKRPRSPESTIEADNFNNRKRAAAADESDDDESLYRGNRRFPVDPSPVALAAAADESDDDESDDDDVVPFGRRHRPSVVPSPVALAATADKSDKKPLSLDEVKAEFMDWAAKSKGYRPENRKNRASVAAGPSEFDEGTRTEFARTVQRVIRWKILHPAKTNNEIATDLDLSRAVVIQALSIE
tara:strand:+ start:12913 stop:14748 length:1836 start_codon:yes stop_codon:yes gene_type:complete